MTSTVRHRSRSLGTLPQGDEAAQPPPRTARSAVMWSWIHTGLRLGSVVALLPLLLRKLSTDDLHIYYIFLRITALLPIIDFGFAPTIERFVTYAVGGAPSLQARGIAASAAASPPNLPLLIQLLVGYREIYRRLSVVAFLLLGALGTYSVATTHGDRDLHTWIAWTLTLSAALLEIYTAWWHVYLRGLNRVADAARFCAIGYGIQLPLACGMLLLGAGLVSVPIASLLGTTVQRYLCRREVLALVGDVPATVGDARRDVMTALWPTTWRTGLQYSSQYIGTSVPVLWLASTTDAATFSSYGFSLQILEFAMAVASVWTSVLWPKIGQHRVQSDAGAVRRLMRPAVARQTATFAVLVIGALVVGPFALRVVGAHTQLLPTHYFAVLALNGWLLMRFSLWTTLLATENHIPSLRPTVITNVIALAIFAGLTFAGVAQLQAVIAAPLAAGLLFNYWYWPIAGARSLGTTWLRFVTHSEARPVSPSE